MNVRCLGILVAVALLVGGCVSADYGKGYYRSDRYDPWYGGGYPVGGYSAFYHAYPGYAYFPYYPYYGYYPHYRYHPVFIDKRHHGWHDHRDCITTGKPCSWQGKRGGIGNKPGDWIGKGNGSAKKPDGWPGRKAVIEGKPGEQPDRRVVIGNRPADRRDPPAAKQEFRRDKRFSDRQITRDDRRQKSFGADRIETRRDDRASDRQVTRDDRRLKSFKSDRFESRRDSRPDRGERFSRPPVLKCGGGRC